MNKNSCQVFEHSSWWQFMSQPEYVRHTDSKQHRKDRGEVFLYDTQRWLFNNELIPLHAGPNNATLRILTWNVRYWTNYNYEPSHHAIIDVLQTINADIVILQEAEFNRSEYNPVDAQEIISSFRKMGYMYGGLDTLGTIWSARNTRYGTVIFSKYPLEDICIQRFAHTALWAENQSYVRARVNVNDKKFVLYGTHLGAESTPIRLVSAEQTRLAQVKQLIELIDQQENNNVLIAADCNAVRTKDLEGSTEGQPIWDIANKDYQDYTGIDRSSAALDFLATNNFKNSFEYVNILSPKVTTWSGIAVDHIFLSPQWNLPLESSYVYFTAASDHYPIIMDVDIR